MKATYESLVGNLKGELDSGKLQVQQLRDGISVNLAQDILFKSGSAQIDPESQWMRLPDSVLREVFPWDEFILGQSRVGEPAVGETEATLGSVVAHTVGKPVTTSPTESRAVTVPCATAPI